MRSAETARATPPPPPRADLDVLLGEVARGDQGSAIAQDMLATGIGARGTVGAARCHLFEAAEVLAFGVAWIEKRLGRNGGRSDKAG